VARRAWGLRRHGARAERPVLLASAEARGGLCPRPGTGGATQEEWKPGSCLEGEEAFK